MERAIVAALADAGIEARHAARRGPDYTGVWVGERKIASIGVHVSSGDRAHGFAVNVDNDLAPFEWIVACGLPGRADDVDARRGRTASVRASAGAWPTRFARGSTARGCSQRLVLERAGWRGRSLA